MKEMKERLLRLEMKMLKNELIITGIEEKKEVSDKDALQAFLKETMKITEEIKVYSTLRLGNGNNRPLLVKLSSAASKSVIYSNVSNLKDVKNKNGKNYQISDHLPEEMNEQSRRSRQIWAANKSLPRESQTAMTFKKGQLKVNNAPYKKKVEEISGKDVLQMTGEELQELQEVAATTESCMQEKGSTFFMYAAKVASLVQVRKLHKHMTIKYGDATHIMMAYKLDGINKAYDEDYIDGGEHGSGRRLLAKLNEHQVTSTALVAIRYYGGSHMGVRRFEILQEMAEKALNELKQDKETFSRYSLFQTIGQSAAAKKKPRHKQRNKGVISKVY